MVYIAGDIVTLVQKRVKDTNYDSTEIKGYLNDTQNDIFNEYRLPFMEASQAYTTVANVADITNGVGLPTNYSQAIDLLNTTANQVVPYKDIRDIDTLYSDPDYVTSISSSPNTYWYLYAQVPSLFPVPTTSYNLTLRYYKQPTLLVADSDVPSIPSAFQELLVLGAAYRILEIKDNYDQAAILEKRYSKKLIQLVVKSSPKQVGHATQMRINRYSVSKRNF